MGIREIRTHHRKITITTKGLKTTIMRKLFTFLAVGAIGLGVAGAYTINPISTSRKAEVAEKCYPNGKLKPEALKQMRKAPAKYRSQVAKAPLGAIFYCGFDTEDEFNNFAVIDGNGDNQSWFWGSSTDARINYNSSMDMDDWLISPAVQLEAGKMYTVKVDAACESTSYPETLEICIGTGRTVADMIQTIVQPTQVTDTEFTTVSGTFTPPTSGEYTLMIHGISPADQYVLHVDNVMIQEPTVIPGEDAITYNEVLLYESDFSQVPGSFENPVEIEGTGHYLEGAEGWRGLDVKGVGGAIMIDFENGTSGWSQLAPPKAQFSPTSDGVYNARVEIEARVVQYSQQALDFGNYEALSFTAMTGSSQCPNGWVWGGNEADFNGYFDKTTNWNRFSEDVSFSGSKSLIDDNFDNINDMISLGEYPLDNYSGRMTSYCGSNYAVRSYKIYQKVPAMTAPSTWEYFDYTPTGFSMRWNPVEGASYYVVNLYEADKYGDYAQLLSQQVVSDTQCHFDTETADGRMLYVDMFTFSGDVRSPQSVMRRVFQVNSPEFGRLHAPVDGDFDIPVTWDPTTHELELYVLAGNKNANAVSDFVINEESFAGRPDYDADNDENAMYQTAMSEPGWSIYPLISFQNGAAVRNNSLATWGFCDYMTIAGNSAYDFSGIEGKIRVKVTAKTSGYCKMTAQLLQFDDIERYYIPFASDSKDLGNAYQTIEFELDPQGRDNVFIQISTDGQDTEYIKDIKVTCDLPAESTFLRPVLVGSVDVRGSQSNSEKIQVKNMPLYDRIRVAGQAYRALIDTGDDGSQTLVYNARSPYAEPAEFDIDAPVIYDMPFNEGFDNASYSNSEWKIVPISGETATVAPANYDPTTGLYPQGSKRDKGFLRVENDKAGEFYLLSPLMEVAPGMDDAVASWYYFHSSGITVEGALEENGEIVEDSSMTDWGSDQMNPDWTSISTSGWPTWGSRTGSLIRLGWKVTTDGEGGSFCMDNFFFGLMPKYDLGLVHAHATPSVKPGEEMTASVEVGVYGQLTTTKFHVNATLDGQSIGQVGNPSKGPWGANRTLCEFPVTLPEDIELGEHEVAFEVVFEGDYAGTTDADLSNNTATATFKVVNEHLPVAVNLKNDSGVLTWNVPAKGDRFTDDMEALASFDDGSLDVIYELHPIYEYDVLARTNGNTGTIGGYKVIDIDQKPTISDDNWVEMNMPNVYHLMACTVADFTVDTDGFAAASGDKALLFWSNADGTECDNYLVLPQLNDNDKKISFKARAYDSDSPEKIEIMTSTTGNEAEDFTAAKSVDITSGDYADVEFEAPAGTTYVAIRHISDEGYGLLVDDLAYAMNPRTVTGYNVYRDGVKVDTCETPVYVPEENGDYSISVVYPEGESELTAPVYVQVSGIDSIEAAAEGEAVYYNMQGIRVDNPVNGAYVKVVNGKATKVIL